MEMIVARQQRLEILQNCPFGGDVHPLGAPEPGDERFGVARLSRLNIGTGQRHRAFRAFRRAASEGCDHGPCRPAFAPERLLAVDPKTLHARPAGQFGGGRRNLDRGHVVGARQRDRPGQDLAVERTGSQPLANAARLGLVPVGQRLKPFLQLPAHRRDGSVAHAGRRDRGGERPGRGRQVRRGAGDQRIGGCRHLSPEAPGIDVAVDRLATARRGNVRRGEGCRRGIDRRAGIRARARHRAGVRQRRGKTRTWRGHQNGGREKSEDAACGRACHGSAELVSGLSATPPGPKRRHRAGSS